MTAFSGTIVVALNRGRFAVIGTDSLVSRGGGDRPYESFLVGKVYCHERLPLAIASGGLAALPPGDDHVTSLLEAIGDSFSKRKELTANTLTERLKAQLAPRVKQARMRRLELQPGSDVGKLKVYFALAQKHEIIMRCIVMDDKTDIIERPGIYGAPDSLVEFYRANEQDLFADRASNDTALAEHVSKWIGRGIDHEATDPKVPFRATSRPVQVAVVTPDGARFHRIPDVSSTA